MCASSNTNSFMIMVRQECVNFEINANLWIHAEGTRLVCSQSHHLRSLEPRWHLKQISEFNMWFVLQFIIWYMSYELFVMTESTRWHYWEATTPACHVMSCHVMSCHVMSCHVMSCHVMSCHVMSCHVMSCHVMSCHVMSCHVMSLHVMSLHVIACHCMSLHVMMQINEHFHKCQLLM